MVDGFFLHNIFSFLWLSFLSDTFLTFFFSVKKEFSSGTTKPHTSLSLDSSHFGCCCCSVE